MKRHLVVALLSDTLLMGFSLSWLLLVLIPIAFAQDHYFGLWHEGNPATLGIEIAISIFAFAWSLDRVIATFKAERKRIAKPTGCVSAAPRTTTCSERTDGQGVKA